MSRWLRLAFRGATIVVAAVSVVAIAPFLGQATPAQAQLGFGGGSFGTFAGSCTGLGIGAIGVSPGCTFGTGFQGGFGVGQIGGFGGAGQFGGGVGQLGAGQFGGSFAGLGSVGGFGGFLLATPEATVATGEVLPLVLGWIVPPPGTWRELRDLEVRIREGGKVALWVRWDEARNALALVDARTGRTIGSTRRQPGSRGQLSTRLAAVDVAQSAVEDNGDGGDSVALLLPVRFAPAAANRRYLLEIGASHDGGEVFFLSAGTLRVERRRG